jgi:hypothetical protein
MAGEKSEHGAQSSILKERKQCPTFRVEAIGSLPAIEFRRLADGQVLFRYAVGEPFIA